MNQVSIVKRGAKLGLNLISAKETITTREMIHHKFIKNKFS